MIVAACEELAAIGLPYLDPHARRQSRIIGIDRVGHVDVQVADVGRRVVSAALRVLAVEHPSTINVNANPAVEVVLPVSVKNVPILFDGVEAAQGDGEGTADEDQAIEP